MCAWPPRMTDDIRCGHLGWPTTSAAETLEGKKMKRKPAGVLVVSEKKRKLLPFNPSEDPARRLRQMASLPTALTVTSAIFSNELTHVPSMALRSAKHAALEARGMRVGCHQRFDLHYLFQRYLNCLVAKSWYHFIWFGTTHSGEVAVAFLRGVHIFSAPNFDQVDSYHVNVGPAIASQAFSSSSCWLAPVWHDTLKDRTILKIIRVLPHAILNAQTKINLAVWERANSR